MNESPYVTTSRIINEPSNLSDDLRIIADSGTRLDTPTRAIIRQAAELLDESQRMIINTNARLIETQRQWLATNEQLIEARKVAGHAEPIGMMAPAWHVTVVFK